MYFLYFSDRCSGGLTGGRGNSTLPGRSRPRGRTHGNSILPRSALFHTMPLEAYIPAVTTKTRANPPEAERRGQMMVKADDDN